MTARSTLVGIVATALAVGTCLAGAGPHVDASPRISLSPRISSLTGPAPARDAGSSAPGALPVVVAHSPGATTPATGATQARARSRAARPAVARRSGTAAAATVTIRRYVVAPGSQRAIDACHLVLWTRSPWWLAGHNWCGFQWLARVPTGTVVVVTTGPASGRFVVTGHVVLHRQSGALPHLDADLVLQTCVGSGTGLTLARRLH